jgi:hypothetical protein
VAQLSIHGCFCLCGQYHAAARAIFVGRLAAMAGLPAAGYMSNARND